MKASLLLLLLVRFSFMLSSVVPSDGASGWEGCEGCEGVDAWTQSSAAARTLLPLLAAAAPPHRPGIAGAAHEKEGSSSVNLPSLVDEQESAALARGAVFGPTVCRRKANIGSDMSAASSRALLARSFRALTLGALGASSLWNGTGFEPKGAEAERPNGDAGAR